MWILNHISSDSIPKQWILIGGKSYVVGRKGSEILIDFDQAVSRKHATITVEAIDAKDISDLDIYPKITITDEKAKFGTLVDGVKMASASLEELKDGTVLQFGTHDTCRFSLSFKPLTFCCSGYSEHAKYSLATSIAKIGHLSEEITKCTHVLMREVRVTNKLLIGMVMPIPIVDETFIEDILETKDYQRSIPDGKGFLPPVLQPDLKDSNMSFMVNPARKSVFVGKSFVTLRGEDFNRVQTIVETGGGTVHKTSQEKPTIKALDTLFNSISDQVYVLVPDVKHNSELYEDIKKKVAGTKKKPAIYTIEDIGLAVLAAKFGASNLNPTKPADETPRSTRSSSRYPNTPTSDEKAPKEPTPPSTPAVTQPQPTSDPSDGTPKIKPSAVTKTTPLTEDEAPIEEVTKRGREKKGANSKDEEQTKTKPSPKKKQKTEDVAEPTRKSPRNAKKAASDKQEEEHEDKEPELERGKRKGRGKGKETDEDNTSAKRSLSMKDEATPAPSPSPVAPTPAPQPATTKPSPKKASVRKYSRKAAPKGNVIAAASPPPSPPPQAPSPIAIDVDGAPSPLIESSPPPSPPPKTTSTPPKKSPTDDKPSHKIDTSSPIATPSKHTDTTKDESNDTPFTLRKRPSFENDKSHDNSPTPTDVPTATPPSTDDNLKMVTQDTPMVGGWMSSKRFKKASSTAETPTKPQEPPVLGKSMFEAHTEITKYQQEWLANADLDSEKDMESSVRADQLFESKFGGHPAPTNKELSSYIMNKAMSNNALTSTTPSKPKAKTSKPASKPTPKKGATISPPNLTSSSSSASVINLDDDPSDDNVGSFQEFLKSGKPTVQSKLKWGPKK